MTKFYNDKDPINGRLQGMMSDREAVKMWIKQGKVKSSQRNSQKEPKPMSIMWLIIGCFVALYLVCAALSVNVMKQHYEDKFERNQREVISRVISSLEDNAEHGVNSFWDIEGGQEQYQIFSVAVYDEEGKQLAVTKPSLSFEIGNDKKLFYFPLEEYFKETEINTLLSYVSSASEKYYIKAEIAEESKTLLTFSLSSSSNPKKEAMWEWMNPKIEEYEKEGRLTYRKRSFIYEVFSIPYDGNKNMCEAWERESFLHAFDKTVDVTTQDFTESDTGILKNKFMHEQRVKIEDSTGENHTYRICVKSVEKPLQAAWDAALPVCVVGFVFAAVGIYFTIINLNKFRKKEIE